MQISYLEMLASDFQTAIKHLGDDATFPAKHRIRIARWLSAVRGILRQLEEARQLLAQKYVNIGAKRKGISSKGLTRVEKPEMADYNQEWLGLLAEKVNIPDIEKVPLPDDSKLTPSDLVVLDTVIDMSEPEPAKPAKQKQKQLKTIQHSDED